METSPQFSVVPAAAAAPAVALPESNIPVRRNAQDQHSKAAGVGKMAATAETTAATATATGACPQPEFNPFSRCPAEGERPYIGAAVRSAFVAEETVDPVVEPPGGLLDPGGEMKIDGEVVDNASEVAVTVTGSVDTPAAMGAPTAPQTTAVAMGGDIASALNCMQSLERPSAALPAGTVPAPPTVAPTNRPGRRQWRPSEQHCQQQQQQRQQHQQQHCWFSDVLFAYNLRVGFTVPRDVHLESHPLSVYGMGEFKSGLWGKGASSSSKTSNSSKDTRKLKETQHTDNQLANNVRWFSACCKQQQQHLQDGSSSSSNRAGFLPSPAQQQQDDCLQSCLLRTGRYVGLENLGATCYMNVFLQALYMNVHFRQALLLLPTLQQLRYAEQQQREKGIVHAEGVICVDEDADQQQKEQHQQQQQQRQLRQQQHSVVHQTNEAEALNQQQAQQQQQVARVDERISSIPGETEEVNNLFFKTSLAAPATATGAASSAAAVATEAAISGTVVDLSGESSPRDQDGQATMGSQSCSGSSSNKTASPHPAGAITDAPPWALDEATAAAACKWLCSTRYALVSELQRIFALLQCGVQAALRPDSLAELLAEDVSCQEDANELQHRLLEMLEVELGGLSSPWNFLPSLFRGAHLQAVCCRSCGYTGLREETFYQLSCSHKNEKKSLKEDKAQQQASPSTVTVAPGGAAGVATAVGGGSDAPDVQQQVHMRQLQQQLQQQGLADRRAGAKRERNGAAKGTTTPQQQQQLLLLQAAGGVVGDMCSVTGAPMGLLSALPPPAGAAAAGAAPASAPAAGAATAQVERSSWRLGEDLARQFQRTEQLRGDAKYFCPQCGDKREARKRLQLSLLPPYLQIVVLRYSIDVRKQTGEVARRKLHEALEVPLVMELRAGLADKCKVSFPLGGSAPLLEAGPLASCYRLFAVLQHQGASAASGHYTAIIRDVRYRSQSSSASSTGELAEDRQACMSAASRCAAVPTAATTQYGRFSPQCQGGVADAGLAAAESSTNSGATLLHDALQFSEQKDWEQHYEREHHRQEPQQPQEGQQETDVHFENPKENSVLFMPVNCKEASQQKQLHQQHQQLLQQTTHSSLGSNEATNLAASALSLQSGCSDTCCTERQHQQEGMNGQDGSPCVVAANILISDVKGWELREQESNLCCLGEEGLNGIRDRSKPTDVMLYDTSEANKSNGGIRRSRRAVVRKQHFFPNSDSDEAGAAAPGSRARCTTNRSNMCTTEGPSSAAAIAAAEAAAARLAADLESDDDWDVAATHAADVFDPQPEQEPGQLQRLLQQQQQQQQHIGSATSGTEAVGERWPWVYFNDSCVSPFAFPQCPDSEKQQQQAYEGSLCGTDGVLLEQHQQQQAPVSFPCSPPLQQQQQESSSYLLSRTVHSVTYIRGDIVAAPEDPPLPPALESFVVAENERLFSRIREQEERTRLLTSFVLQQQTFISHLLRQQLPAALRQLELQRQQLEARQAFDAAVAAAEAGDNAAADTAEKRQLLPSLQQLAFVPKSWWSSFVRGTDYPCVSVLLPQHLRPSRDSSNSNSYLHSATERAAKAAATASPQPQQQHDLHEPGESLPDMDELDASLQQHGNQQQQQQHKKSTRKGSTAWTSAVCPEVLEEAGVVDYSSILCPHYIRHLKRQRGVGKRPSFWSANDSSSNSTSSTVGRPYGVDPLAVWSGEAKLIPVSVLKSIFTAVGLRASVETPLLQQAVCSRCAAALRGLADLSALQHREVDLFVSAAKQQQLIASGGKAATSVSDFEGPTSIVAATTARAAAGGSSYFSLTQSQQKPQAACERTQEPAADVPTQQPQQSHSDQQLKRTQEEEEYVFVSRRVLQHMLGQHAVYLSSCSTAARDGPRSGPVMTLLAAAAATQQQRGSRAGKCKSRRVCGESAFAWAAYEDVRKEVIANRVWPLEEEASATGASAVTGRASPGIGLIRDTIGGAPGLEVDSSRTGIATHEASSGAVAEFTAAGSNLTLDVSGELLCSHGNLLPLPLQHSKQKLSPRLLVPAAALLRYLSVERAKWPLLKELDVPQPLALSASRLVPQSASECTICFSEQQQQQQQRQRWRHRMREEEKVLGPVLGSRWTVKREPLQGTSKMHASLPRAGVYQLVPEVWRSQWQQFVASTDEETGSDLRPKPLDVSALICDCAVPGLKVDPTDSVLSPAFLSSPPPSEAAMYLLVHECHFSLLESHGYYGFNSGDAVRATLRVWLTPAGSRHSAPVFFFPHLKPCSSCVSRLRMQSQGLYDFPAVDLPIHLAANCHHALVTSQQQPQEQQQQQQKGNIRSRSAQGLRLFSRRMMAEVSGAMPVDCVVASVVAAVSETTESIRRVRVALRVPGVSVLFAKPEAATAAASASSSDDGVGGGEGVLPMTAVQVVGGKTRYVELSNLVASGGGSVRMRQLGIRVDAECCVHYTVDGTDPAPPEEILGQQPEVEQQPLQHQQQDVVLEVSAQSTNDTNCSNNCTTSANSPLGSSSCSNISGSNSVTNRQGTNTSSGSCSSPCPFTKPDHHECQDDGTLVHMSQSFVPTQQD
ncbi:ubiquitin carboxyl-terminal hydrolase, putative [Eimeria necatrix]|uniref:Ubiquitin carboxyl-terminal hydrolase, putative n=1 Tax=Eimeria necatrix TaxID=51315 RepID=U6MGB6_9EIME|nr:ubiquitin carboxyl-terminal hydrolase, putative [Eimeria necatrix]CDJ63051.1 ubiquitin carboxyl-terminal hydrolase, putative [Eimeria necatrix]